MIPTASSLPALKKNNKKPSTGSWSAISVFTCLCPFVPSKINKLCGSGVMQWQWYGLTLHDARYNSLHACLTKDEMYESYSPWKGHCFAQLPSGTAWGVESHIDKSEMTLKQRKEGYRLLVCPLDQVGYREEAVICWIGCLRTSYCCSEIIKTKEEQ